MARYKSGESGEGKKIGPIPISLHEEVEWCGEIGPQGGAGGEMRGPASLLLFRLSIEVVPSDDRPVSAEGGGIHGVTVRCESDT